MSTFHIVKQFVDFFNSREIKNEKNWPTNPFISDPYTMPECLCSTKHPALDPRDPNMCVKSSALDNMEAVLQATMWSRLGNFQNGFSRPQFAVDDLVETAWISSNLSDEMSLVVELGITTQV